MVPTIVIALTFRASRDTWISYGLQVLINTGWDIFAQLKTL